MKTLEREPRERFQRASELRDALADLERTPAPAPAAEAPEETKQETTEGLLWTVLCVGALVLAAAGIAFLDGPWSLFALYLPGSLVGAVMAERPMPRDDAVFAGWWAGGLHGSE